MLRWIKGKFANERSPENQEWQRGVEKGREMGRQIAEAFLSYADRKGMKVRTAYIEILRDKLQADLQSVQRPPWTAALGSFDEFQREVRSLSEHLMAEASTEMHDWYRLVDEIGLRDDVGKGLSDKFAVLEDSTYWEGVALFREYATPLVDADRKWRAENPELAKSFPLASEQNEPIQIDRLVLETGESLIREFGSLERASSIAHERCDAAFSSKQLALRDHWGAVGAYLAIRDSGAIIVARDP